MPWILRCCLAPQAHRGAALTGVLLCCSVPPAFDGPIVPPPMLACVWRGGGQGEAMVMAPPPTHDSAVSPCFHGCLAFLLRHFPLQSPPSLPLDPSLHSQKQPSPWDCSTIPKLQLAAAVHSRGPSSLPGVCMAAARTV